MSERPTQRERNIAIIIFCVILVAALGLTIYFMTEAAEEIDEADAPDEEETIGAVYGPEETPAQRIAFSAARWS